MLEWLKEVWRSVIVGECNWPRECFECDSGECKGCPVLDDVVESIDRLDDDGQRWVMSQLKANEGDSR